MAHQEPPAGGPIITNVEWWKRDVPTKGTLYVKISPAFSGQGGEVIATYHPYLPDAPATYERKHASLERARILLGLRGFVRVDRL